MLAPLAGKWVMADVEDLIQRLGETLKSARVDADKRPAETAIWQLKELCESLYSSKTELGTGYLYEPYDQRAVTGGWSKEPTQTATTMVPLAWQPGTQVEAGTLKKTALYSDVSVVIIPETVSSMFLGYAGGLRWNWSDYEKLFKHNLRYLSLVTAGRCVFLPRQYTYQEEKLGGNWASVDYAPPYLQRPQELRHLPVNVPLSSSRPPLGSIFLCETFLLPYFPTATLDDIVTLSRTETDSFVLFNHYLTKRLSQLSESQSIEQLSDIADDIRYGISQLRLEARKVAKGKLLRNLQLAFFAVSVVAMVVADTTLVRDVSGILGSVNLLQVIQGELDMRKQAIDLRKSDFYIPYVLSSNTVGRAANEFPSEIIGQIL
jgi:hypothetical protein